MSIDWFTFAAQIVNFLILIWLLQRFLYGPIVRAMTERQDYIAREMSSIQTARTEIEARSQEYDDKLQDLARAKESMMAEAGEEVSSWKTEQLQSAKTDIEDERQLWRQELIREKKTLIGELRMDVTHHAVELGRHILHELSDQSLQSRLVEQFVHRLDDIDTSEFQAKEVGRVTVVSSHELSESDQTAITIALEPLAGQVVFDVSQQLICGIELQAPDCRFTWSIQEALAEVESDLIDALEDTLPGALTAEGQHPLDVAEASGS